MCDGRTHNGECLGINNAMKPTQAEDNAVIKRFFHGTHSARCFGCSLLFSRLFAHCVVRLIEKRQDRSLKLLL